MRVAEMELEKADNLLKHSEEIYSRPARTWFQSSKQKLSSKDASRALRGVAPRPGAEESKPATKQGRAQVEKERLKAKVKEERERSFSQQRARKSKVTKRRRVK
jgi:ATP-dependent RNA helicase DDX27